MAVLFPVGEFASRKLPPRDNPRRMRQIVEIVVRSYSYTGPILPIYDNAIEVAPLESRQLCFELIKGDGRLLADRLAPMTCDEHDRDCADDDNAFVCHEMLPRAPSGPGRGHEMRGPACEHTRQ